MVFKYWDNKEITSHKQSQKLTDDLGLNQQNLRVKSLLLGHENHGLIKNVREAFQRSIFFLLAPSYLTCRVYAS